MIRSLKHDGSVHRVWLESHVLQVGEPFVVANYRTKVVESNGSSHVYPHLAICLFYQSYWFNVVMIYDQPDSQLPRYYCNLASPYRIDWQKKILEYIDYEIDVKVGYDYTYQIVDLDEYEKAVHHYRYPLEVQRNVQDALSTLTNKIKTRRIPFHQTFTKYWYDRFYC